MYLFPEKYKIFELFFPFILTVGFSAVNSVSAHACLPVSVCRSHLPFPASSLSFPFDRPFQWIRGLSHEAAARGTSACKVHSDRRLALARLSPRAWGRENEGGERVEPRLAWRTIRDPWTSNGRRGGCRAQARRPGDRYSAAPRCIANWRKRKKEGKKKGKG